jgi:hypothetical protein
MPDLPIPPTTDAPGLRPEAGRPGAAALRLRRQVAAFSLVGTTLCALPLVQLLRYQSAEFDGLTAGRAKLDPIARAVHLQRGLLAHRDISAQVLGGRMRLEPERKQRQNEVDGRLAAMTGVLATGQWELALGEADALHLDWQQLTQQIATRRIDVPASEEGHRLLVEQTLQVIDLVTAAIAAEAGGGPTYGATSVADSTQALVHGLPRLIWQTAEVERTDSAVTAPAGSRTNAGLIGLEARLSRVLGSLEGSRARSAAPAGPGARTQPGSNPPADGDLLRAGALAGAASERYFALLRNGAERAELDSARNAAVQAQMRLFDMALGRTEAEFARRTRQAELRRGLLLGTLAGLALLALGLLSRIWRLLPTTHPAVDGALEGPSAEPAAGPSEARQRQDSTDALVDRLRSLPGPTPAVVQGPDATTAAAQSVPAPTDGPPA